MGGYVQRKSCGGSENLCAAVASWGRPDAIICVMESDKGVYEKPIDAFSNQPSTIKASLFRAADSSFYPTVNRETPQD